MIKDLRGEAADRRTKFNSAMSTIAEALGIEPPAGTDKPLTPEELAARLAETQGTLSETSNNAKDLAIRLTIFESASEHGGNPAALTDSRAFISKVSSLDPTAEDFKASVIAAAKAAVTENPSLKVLAQATGPSTVSHAGGSGESGDIDARIAAAVAAGDHKLAISLRRQKAYGGSA